MRTLNTSNRRVIEALEDNRAYSPAHIAQLAIDRELLTAKEAARFRRVTLYRYAQAFKGEPDAYVKFPRQGRLAAWEGWRWKEAAGIKAD